MVVVCSIPPGDALLEEPEELTIIVPPPPPVIEVSAYEVCGYATANTLAIAQESAIRLIRQYDRDDFMIPH